MSDNIFNINYNECKARSKLSIIANAKYKVYLTACDIPNNDIYSAFICIDMSNERPYYKLYVIFYNHTHKEYLFRWDMGHSRTLTHTSRVAQNDGRTIISIQHPCDHIWPFDIVKCKFQ